MSSVSQLLVVAIAQKTSVTPLPGPTPPGGDRRFEGPGGVSARVEIREVIGGSQIDLRLPAVVLQPSAIAVSTLSADAADGYGGVFTFTSEHAATAAYAVVVTMPVAGPTQGPTSTSQQIPIEVISIFPHQFVRVIVELP